MSKRTPEEIILLNEQEWRRELWQNQGDLFKEIKELREDMNSFKIRSFGLITVMTGALNAVLYWVNK